MSPRSEAVARVTHSSSGSDADAVSGSNRGRVSGRARGPAVVVVGAGYDTLRQVGGRAKFFEVDLPARLRPEAHSGKTVAFYHRRAPSSKPGRSEGRPVPPGALPVQRPSTLKNRRSTSRPSSSTSRRPRVPRCGRGPSPGRARGPHRLAHETRRAPRGRRRRPARPPAPGSAEGRGGALARTTCAGAGRCTTRTSWRLLRRRKACLTLYVAASRW